MKSDPEFAADLTGFTGVVPIFPLPNVVLFPFVALPLHIFEERYRRMVEDALEERTADRHGASQAGLGDRTTTRAPPIHEMVCLGRITADERFPSGEFNIVVTGIHRAVVVEEAADRSARTGTAKLELYRDFYVDRAGRQPRRAQSRAAAQFPHVCSREAAPIRSSARCSRPTFPWA